MQSRKWTLALLSWGLLALMQGCGADPAATPTPAPSTQTGSAPATAANKAAPASGTTTGPVVPPASPIATPPAVPAPVVPPGLHNDANIFAVSPIYTVFPDGKVGELTSGEFGALAKQNGCFDAGRQTITLQGARNQEVAAQIVIPMEGAGFQASAGEIEGILADRVTFSMVGYDLVIRKDKDGKVVSTRLMPDVIVPLDGSVAGLKSFDVPQQIKGMPEAKNKQGLLLLELWIPKTASLGLHRGTVSVRQGDRELAKLGVELSVYDLELPDQPTYRMDYLSYSSPLKQLGGDAEISGGGSKDFTTAPAAIAAEHQVYGLTLDNRGFLNILPYASQRGNPIYGYPVAGVGKDAKIVSFEGFDTRFGPVLEGKVGKYKTPPAVFSLPYNLNYPYTMASEPAKQFDFGPFHKTIPDGPGKDEKLKELEETWRAVGQATLAHFAEKGWTRTAFELYNNQKPASNNRSPWKLDEPVEAADYKGLRYLFTLGKWAFEGAADKKVKIITRVDIGHWECDRMRTLDGKITACYKAKEFNTGHAEEVLKPVTDRWVAGHTHVQGCADLIPSYNTEQVMFDTYGGAGEEVPHGGSFVGVCWIGAKLGVEGRVIYKSSFHAPTAVVDDCTLYSGKDLGFYGALASRRVKLWRDAVNDYDLLLAARRKDPKALDSLFAQVLKVGPAADERYRVESKTIETYFTNNVE
ncbi:MAG TPA: hypothetical protein VL860_04925, partial [Planctomycetota bacterium]|nr:hypothetical protein [Planctomycetota bacterium]